MIGFGLVPDIVDSKGMVLTTLLRVALTVLCRNYKCMQ